jgi:hypothetical protein
MLELSYNSASIDGRTSGMNTQGSWAGDGWDLWPGYIERTYRSCADDEGEQDEQEPNNKDVDGGDLCYFNDNATMSINGSAVELAKVSTTDGGNTDTNVEYRAVNDDGSKVEQLRGSLGADNGDDDRTFWRLTKPDGTQYYFGRDKVDGGSTGGMGTNSVFTVPV